MESKLKEVRIRMVRGPRYAEATVHQIADDTFIVPKIVERGFAVVADDGNVYTSLVDAAAGANKCWAAKIP